MVTALVTVRSNFDFRAVQSPVADVVQGSSRGLGLGFIRKLLLRPQYKRIIAAARIIDEAGELCRLRDESEGRIGVVRLSEVSDVESCQVSF